MIFKYPYSDMYALNLDWILQVVREAKNLIEEQGTVVNSVNGQTGDVTISDEMINAASVGIIVTFGYGISIDSLTQSILNNLYANGKRILLFKNNLETFDRVYFLYKNGENVGYIFYNPASSAAGVRTVNGFSGDVTITADTLPYTQGAMGTSTKSVINGIESDIGDVDSLQTTADVVVNAINELLTSINSLSGDLSDEVSARIDGDEAVEGTLSNALAKVLEVDEGGVAQMSAAVGDYVYYEYTLYRCIAAITGGTTVINTSTIGTYLQEVLDGGLNSLNGQKVYDIRYNNNKILQSKDGINYTDVLTVDKMPTGTSNNPVSSSGVTSLVGAHFEIISSGSFHDIIGAGIYYIGGSVADKPSNNGGFYAVTNINSIIIAGIFIDAILGDVFRVQFYNGTWDYKKIAFTQ